MPTATARRPVPPVEDVPLPVPDDTDETGQDDAPGAVEAMQAEAAPREKPAGSPELHPFVTLKRRDRAKFLRGLAPLQRMSTRGEDAEGEAGGADQGGMLDALADITEAAADIEDLLRTVAVDQDAFDAWSQSATDMALLDLVLWYSERFQVGEAPASSPS